MGDQEYITRVLIPYYQGYTHKPIIIGVISGSGKYLIASDRTAQIYGYPSAHEMGLIGPENIKGGLSHSHLELFYARLKLCEELKRPIEFLGNWRNNFYYTTFTPLFFPDGRYLGAEFISEPFNIEWFMDIYVQLHGYNLTAPIANQDLRLAELTELQQQVLFLLIANKSQYDIGAILGRSRNSIKEVAEQLYRRFNVSNSQDLVTHAIADGFHRRIPAPLLHDNSVLVHVFSDEILYKMRAAGISLTNSQVGTAS
jgi:DNA-binding CsgD family transcriptional regulator